MAPRPAADKPNAQYNVARPDSLAIRVTAMMRRRMYERFLAVSGLAATETVIDVGVTSDRGYVSSNYLEAWYPHKDKLTAAGMDDAGFLEKEFPGVRFLFANGKALPFAEGAFDVVHSSAVVEHVGSLAEQAHFIGELYRVARRLVCITTPNRWFPVEVHTSLPLIHWLPAAKFRAVLRTIGLPFFAEAELEPAGGLRIARDLPGTRDNRRKGRSCASVRMDVEPDVVPVERLKAMPGSPEPGHSQLKRVIGMLFKAGLSSSSSGGLARRSTSDASEPPSPICSRVPSRWLHS